MIQIEEPPDIRACARTQDPLLWLWSSRTGRWCAFSTIPGDPDLIRVHRCESHGDPAPSWRHLEEQDPQTARAGAQRVRRALEDASKENET